ncbi:MAG: hypothetical protein ACRD21_01355 [Vicinamibacteria bacterium]
MMTTDELKRLWQERSAASASPRSGCLGEESFAALLAGELEAETRIQAASHIAACRHCAAEFRELRAVADLFERERPKRSWLSPQAFALAASLLLALGLGAALLWSRSETARRAARFEGELEQRERALLEAREAHDAEVASLRERLESAASPRLDAPIVDLDPFAATRGGRAGAVPTVEVSEGADLVTLILNFPPKRPEEGFRVAVFDEGGELRFQGRTSRGRERASLNLTLPRAAAPGGLYRIRLSAGDEVIAEYRVRLRYAGERP